MNGQVESVNLYNRESQYEVAGYAGALLVICDLHTTPPSQAHVIDVELTRKDVTSAYRAKRYVAQQLSKGRYDALLNDGTAKDNIWLAEPIGELGLTTTPSRLAAKWLWPDQCLDSQTDWETVFEKTGFARLQPVIEELVGTFRQPLETNLDENWSRLVKETEKARLNITYYAGEYDPALGKTVETVELSVRDFETKVTLPRIANILK